MLFLYNLYIYIMAAALLYHHQLQKANINENRNKNTLETFKEEPFNAQDADYTFLGS